MSATASSISQGFPGGDSAVLGIYNAQVIKPAPGILVCVLVVTPGSSGNLTINDCANVGDATSANQIDTFAAASLTPGQPIKLDWPCTNGITLSSVPSGSQFSVTYS